MVSYSPVIKEISSPSIGKLYLCRLTLGEEIKFQKAIGDRIWSCSPKDFFDSYLQFALRRDLEETRSSADGSYLSRDDVAMLTAEEKEDLASAIVDDSQYLFRKPAAPPKDKQASLSHGDITLPKKQQETPIEYFKRLKKNEADEQVQTLKKLKKSFNFSDQLNNKMLNLFSGLNGPIFNLPPIQKGRLTPDVEKPYMELPILKDYKLDVLYEIRDQQHIQGDHFNSALATMAEMLNEQKGATNWNKVALIVTATLALASLIVSSFATYSTFKESTSTNAAIERLQNSIGATERLDSEGMTLETSVLRELRESNELKKELINVLQKQSVVPKRAVPIQHDSP